MTASPLCIIPARGGSKRFPRKNIALLGQKPLIAWSIAAAGDSQLFENIWVSSEDESILALAEKHGGRPLPRAAELAGDNVTVAELCCATVDAFAARGEEYPAVYVLLPTCPFRRGKTIAAAWRLFEEQRADALMSVTPLKHPPEWALTSEEGWLRPVDAEGFEIPRPKLVPRYCCDGGHTIIRTEALRQRRGFMVERTVAFEAPVDERVDIDEPIDLAWAEFLLAQRKRV